MRVLVVGCGYVGLPVAVELVRLGHPVFGLRRTAAASDLLQAAGIQPLQADITQAGTLAQLPGPFDWVVNCVGSGQGDVEGYRAVYQQGTQNLIEWLALRPPQKFVYTSSTSVYAQDDGSDQFKYPTFRQGYTAEIQRLHNADQLDLKPEPR